ncbi:MAG: protein phosphatase 2C domain-containing protein [Gammaproteobacteria bacterium]|nr:protein phosphatase 2C domain-containing protein [Gammaproteobacteria bacterium]
MSDESSWQWVSAGDTNVGNVRKINEDAILDLPQHGLWVVADGMGGHHAGDLASSSIVNALSQISVNDEQAQFVDLVEDHIKRVNYELYTLSKQGGSDSVIGSTVAALVALDGYGVCIWAGDSRVYRLRNFELEQLTVDHSEVEELIAEGALHRSKADGHPGENIITRAVGGEENLNLEMKLVPLKHGDRYLLCSDGLYKDVSADEIGKIMADGNTADVTRNLLACALSRRCADNVSVIAVDFEKR